MQGFRIYAGGFKFTKSEFVSVITILPQYSWATRQEVRLRLGLQFTIIIIFFFKETCATRVRGLAPKAKKKILNKNSILSYY